MNLASTRTPPNRLHHIDAARQAVLKEGRALADPQQAALSIEPWIERSWRRCLASGQQPGEHLAFDAVSREAMRRVAEASRVLVAAARPVLGQLAHAMAHTRYFAILTDAQGVVVDVDGPVDRDDRRASLIARVGVNLSEQAVGTTAIGAALHEQQPVWLHRGEHFFNENSVYSCAGAPVFGPDGQCVGMLDLTGVEVPERPELKHLVTLSARRIENAMLHQQDCALMVRLNWAGGGYGAGALAGYGGYGSGLDAGAGFADGDGLICLDADGYVTATNTAARQMLPMPLTRQADEPLHCSDLFAMPWENLFDAALLGAAPLEVPLWSGLRLQALPLQPDVARQSPGNDALARSTSRPLRALETDLIRKAVDQAKGNVAQAARALGISRATVYRKLGQTR